MGRGRLGLSAIDKREIWSRWKAGETLHEIGRAYGNRTRISKRTKVSTVLLGPAEHRSDCW